MTSPNPLRVVEQRLGFVDTWPSSIIWFPFLERPTHRAFRVLSAFFYGNYISPSLATKLYELCNIHFTSLVGGRMRNYCIEWQRKRCTPHLSQYYDIRLLRFVWINGFSLNQREVVRPEVTVMDFGFEGCFPQRHSEIRNKLLLLRWQ
jgi:hypothetical protein